MRDFSTQGPGPSLELPREVTVHAEVAPCPYLPEESSLLPLRLPTRMLSRQELDTRLAQGDRRQGLLLYRPGCPVCRGCEPIRIPVNDFAPNRSQRRVMARGRAELEVEIGPPILDDERVALYDHHKRQRGLLSEEAPITRDGYRHFLVDTCTDTFELRYRHRGKLIALAVTDRAAASLSAVYCYFDPEHSSFSPGTFSVLVQLELCRQWGLKHLYLGYYIQRSPAMIYKGRYRPHERLIDGRWKSFDDADWQREPRQTT